MRTDSIELIKAFMDVVCRHAAACREGGLKATQSTPDFPSTYSGPVSLIGLLNGHNDLLSMLSEHYRQEKRSDLAEVLDSIRDAAIAQANRPDAPVSHARLSGLVYPVV